VGKTLGNMHQPHLGTHKIREDTEIAARHQLRTATGNELIYRADFKHSQPFGCLFEQLHCG
jgi:hypothetical protein